ncbi:MAG: hypothetical protein RIB01_15370 [Balneola sp.]
MLKEISYIVNNLPNAETRTDVWALQTLYRIISGDCNDPVELEYFQDTNYYAQFKATLRALKNEIKNLKTSLS